MRELGIQEYFPFKDTKSKKAALDMAVARRDELLKIHRLRQSLGFKQLFSDKGMIKGLRFNLDSPRASLSLILFDQQEGRREKFIKQRVVKPDTIDDVFFALLDELIELKELTLDYQDKALIKKVRMTYVRLFNELYETRILPVKKKTSVQISAIPSEPPSLFADDQKYIKGLRVTDKKNAANPFLHFE
jgi:hypothetical protein